LKPYLWALGLLWGLPALGVAVGYLVLPKDLEGGGCEGIGFGCSPAPADGLVIYAMFLGVPVLGGVGLLVCAVIAVVQSVTRTRPARSASGAVREG
jgi:hypothetical protein